MITVPSHRFLRVFKEGSWVIAGQGLAVVGTVVGVRLLTERLDPASYGELALGMTLATLVNHTVLGALGSGIARFYAPASESRSVGAYLRAVRRLVLASSCIVLLLLLVLVFVLVLAGRPEWVGLAAASVLYALISGYGSFLGGIQNAARHRAIVAAHQALDAWARFLLAVILLIWLGANSAIAMAGYALASGMVLTSQYTFFRLTIARQDRSSTGRELWQRQIVDYSWPFAAWGVFTWAQIASDRWALAMYSRTEDVGLYSLLYQLGYYPITLASGMVVQFIGPILYQRAGDATDRERLAGASRLAGRLTAATLALTGGAFVVALGFHRLVFQLLAAREYASVSHLLPWVLLGGGLFAAGQTIALELLGQMRVREMMAPKIVTAVAGVGLNFAGAYLYGTEGIVIAGVLFSASYFVWMLLLSMTAGVAGR